MVFAGCQKPADLIPAKALNGINSFTAKFDNDTRDENNFKAEIDYENHVITVVFPYTYPANSAYHLDKDDLKRVRVYAGLDDNVIISPALLYMDLSGDVENWITVTTQTKEVVRYEVKGEIRKSNACAITKFVIPAKNANGVINEGTKEITFMASGMGLQFADATISFGATISPDPSATKLDYSVSQTFTVTAQDGTTKAEYRTVISSVIETVEYGIREGSGNILWQKKIADDLGNTNTLDNRSIAATEDYVFLLTKGEDLIYMDAATGDKLGTYELPQKAGDGMFDITADAGDNLLICSLTPAGGTFKIYRFKDLNEAPVEFLSWTNTAGVEVGRRISVFGNIDDDAVITVSCNATDASKFLRWQVSGGALVSASPEIVSCGGVGAFKYNADIISTSATNPSADYFLMYYGTPYSALYMDGSANTVKAQSEAYSSNWVINAVDYVVFNKCPYVAHNTVNSFTWGSDDKIFLFDFTSGDFSKLIWNCDPGLYGTKDVAIGTANANANGDVDIKATDYYMNLYFMFSGGYIVCMQYDCLKM